MSLLEWFYSAGFDVAGYRLSVMELVGVTFGLGSAIGGMLRKVWAWPIGIVGNAILFFVYVGITIGLDDGADKAPLFGQSGRQIFFIVTSLYGWWRWSQVKRVNQHERHAITPRWQTMNQRLLLVAGWVAGVIVGQWVFAQLGAGWPAPRWYYWADAWIFVGSFVATFAMAKGWNEFWLAWIAVDLVGVPLLWHSGYVPTAVLYAVYAVFVVYGFTVWLRASRTERPDRQPEERAAGAAT
ncbi:nicotinamide riboside transporter PnuC [Marihabitans asiaticum]|uniref:Nicotinamide mononucleotide transporter n=1 Tax=Marihabitans asiaticum TaxID=415218 RepID=A0A560WAQ8_9MICO|nr:nicotinamide mononucleotide transporter family protein [Marihabitans asiaticum]TWD14711.1 nicotinamide mononucleotide transporter [Marihabitans asiaticum]